MNPVGGGRWVPGDRLTDVRLQTRTGERIMLHGELAGAPLWLCPLSSGYVDDGAVLQIPDGFEPA